MTQATIFAALRLPSGVLSSLESGNITAIHAQSFIRPNQEFALYADDSSNNEVKISLWAHFESSQKFLDKSKCDLLATRLQVPVENLQDGIDQNGFIWIAYLRVYHLPSPITITNTNRALFIALEDRIYINELRPVLDDITYEKRKLEILNFEPPEPLDIQIQRMLEEVEINRKAESLKEFGWVKTITTLGDRSIEGDDKKSTVKAGTDFENIVKRSLEFLGFTIDQDHKGGAGGLDLCCSQPYLLIGECKAGKSIPKGTTEEIMRIGMTKLATESEFKESSKLIIGSGRPTPDVIKFSTKWKVSIIKTMTLQKLVELKAKYDGAINLFELKEYLQAGQIDDKIDGYIQKVENDIKLRSHIVQVVKGFLLNNSFKDVETNIVFGLYAGSHPPKYLSTEELKELLIELSSPLAGYLGRVEENGKKCDRFYYLRDLPCDTQN